VSQQLSLNRNLSLPGCAGGLTSKDGTSTFPKCIAFEPAYSSHITENHRHTKDCVYLHTRVKNL
jgi:hypothetical protein